MIKRLNDVLQNQGENYILPFFWQHGETEEVLREYMGAIQGAGIGAVCVECRPHPDFCGEQWWHDMDIILDEARTRGMKVWILDDAHFPTGQANGAMKTAPDELCKQYLFYNVCDVAGPTPCVELDVEFMSHRIKSFFNMAPADPRGGPPREFKDDKMLAVVAAKADGEGIDASTLVNLTHLVDENNMLYWDVPGGYWRIFVLYLTRNGMGTQHYINMVSKESCYQQIKAVYEPHWEHYKDDFGKTIAGFFSDEPPLGNINGGYENWIGNPVPISWSDEVEAALKERMGEDYITQMPAIWYPSLADGVTAKVRYIYMDIITRLVERDFSLQIGDWCADHGVRYIGHTIEDNNQHARMGQSFGHQFRGLAGQHMAGIDCIGGQVLLGGEHDLRCGSFVRGSASPELDGEFFHFLLGKLGSSHGHLDPRKNGATMCELFGAYGWSSGTRLQKYLTDHLLVRGVNHFVPHAFSPREFPDGDCPPHFYAHGYNPLYQGFGNLMRYMNRISHLFNGGKAIAPVGLLYHAEAEWAGRQEGYMLTQKPARALVENQIDFEIIWSDLFTETERFGTQFDGKTLTINGNHFRALVVPYTCYVTEDFAAFVRKANESGFPVLFVEGLPAKICGTDAPAALEGSRVVTLAELPQAVRQMGIYDVTLSNHFEGIRYYRYQQESDIYMISNESCHETFSGWAELKTRGVPVLYNAMDNRVEALAYEATAEGVRFDLTLAPYESVLVCFDTELTGETEKELRTVTTITGPWSISFSDARERNFDKFGAAEEVGHVESFQNLSRKYPKFSGVVRYRCSFDAKSGPAALELENAYEAAQVTVNGKKSPIRICPPYRFDLTDMLQDGENELSIDVFTTLERLTKNIPPAPGGLPPLPVVSTVNPYGLVGKVSLITE